MRSRSSTHMATHSVTNYCNTSVYGIFLTQKIFVCSSFATDIGSPYYLAIAAIVFILRFGHSNKFK